MKDFLLYRSCSNTVNLDKAILSIAIRETFARRHTKLPDDIPTALTPAFTGDNTKKMQWKAFLKKRTGWTMRSDWMRQQGQIKTLLLPLIGKDRTRRCLNYTPVYISADLKRDKNVLLGIAQQFSYSIEAIDDGVLFNVSGLEGLIGKPTLIAQKILEQLQINNVAGSIAVAETVDTAVLLARQNKGLEHVVHSPDMFQQLPLHELDIEQDTLNVLNELGIKSVEQMLDIPREELISRYGREFQQ